MMERVPVVNVLDIEDAEVSLTPNHRPRLQRQNAMAPAESETQPNIIPCLTHRVSGYNELCVCCRSVIRRMEAHSKFDICLHHIHNDCAYRVMLRWGVSPNGTVRCSLCNLWVLVFNFYIILSYNFYLMCAFCYFFVGWVQHHDLVLIVVRVWL